MLVMKNKFFSFNEMAGKKRRLKKIAKRKLKKEELTVTDSKRKDKENKENKVQKIDNQTLQQLMTAQMMSSRARVSNGEGVSWITTQNQANADRMRYQQEINAKEKEAKEWKIKAENVEENKKYKDILEKYNRSIEEKKTAIERLKKLEPLEEELNQLKKKKAELEDRINNPLNMKELEITKLEKYIEHMKANLDARDPKYKEMSDKIAIKEATLKKYREQKELVDRYDQVSKELREKQAQMKAEMEYLRKKYPNDLSGLSWNAKNRDEKIINLTNKAIVDLDDYNKQLEMLKETGEEMRILNQTKDLRDKYEENFRKKHPLFVPIFESKLNSLDGDVTMADETKAFIDAFKEYKTNLEDNMAAISKADEELGEAVNDDGEADAKMQDELAVAPFGPGTD